MRRESSRSRFEFEELEPRILLTAEPTGTAACADLAAAMGGTALALDSVAEVPSGSTEAVVAFAEPSEPAATATSIFAGVELESIDDGSSPAVVAPADDTGGAGESVVGSTAAAEVAALVETVTPSATEQSQLPPVEVEIAPSTEPAETTSTVETYLTDTLKAPNAPPAAAESATSEIAVCGGAGSGEAASDPVEEAGTGQNPGRPIQPMGGELDDTLDGATALEMVEDPAGSGYFVGRANEQIDVPSDVDYWRFNALAGDSVAVSLDTYGSGVDVYIELRNAADGVIASDNNGGPYNDDYISNYKIGSSGSYYVRVRSHGGVGTYEVRVEMARGMDLESDGDYANDGNSGADGLTLVQEGNVQKGRIAGTVMNRQGGNWDEDRYVLGVLNAGNTVELEVGLPVGSSLVPWVRVLNSAGQEVLDEDPSGERFFGTILASDTYYAEVSNRYWVWEGHGYGYSAWGTWAVAEAGAVGMGGHLVGIGSVEEQRFVYGAFSSEVADIWVGITDEGEEGVWVWVSGEGVSYTNWAEGEPNSGDSYDYGYMHSGNGLWYDGHVTHERWGVAEWVDSEGRAYAGSGPFGQYVMGVEIGDGVAPAVVGVNRLPAEGGRTANVLATFSVMFSEALAPGTVNAVEAWDLREAGLDGVFGSGDDVVYGLAVAPVYGVGTTVSVVLTDGPMGSGKYRLTVRESVTDVVGNLLDGDGDGAAGGDYVLNFEVALPGGYVFEGRSNESQGLATDLGMVEGLSGLWLGHGLGSLDGGSDQDWWVFEAGAGDRVGVAMDSVQVNGYIHLYNEAGQELWGENDGGPGSSDYYSYWTAPAAGKYYVRVRSHGGVGTYEVRVEMARGMDLESDGDYANDGNSGRTG